MRLANVYFLIIAILLSIKVISPLDPLTAWAPLIIVIAISMMREGYEDFQRFRSDKQLNNDKAKVFRNGEWNNAMIWGNILVGDIVKV
jgi:magnesium-transporting ATPase (P-type)